MTDQSETRKAYAELLDVLRRAGDEYLGPAYGVTDPYDVADGHRMVLHVLQSALLFHMEADPAHPVFHRIVSPTRKFTGDNPDAVYFEAPVDPSREYVVRGNLAGAVYTSFTVEAGAAGGAYASHTDGVLRDDDIDVDADGNYEIRLGGPPADRNWLALPPGAGRITTRHYFEWERPAAADPSLHIPLVIEAVGPVEPLPRPDDAWMAEAIRRVTTHVASKTVEQPRPTGQPPAIEWISPVPNTFVKPMKPGNMAFAAADAAYSMARYQLGPDEALVMTGRWPECRFANVSIWTRFSQTYDYLTRPTSRNRANTTLEPDGTFRMVLAHRDPGVPNWIDTEGRPSGSIFWRYFLPEGEIEAPVGEVVPFEAVSR